MKIISKPVKSNKITQSAPSSWAAKWALWRGRIVSDARNVFLRHVHFLSVIILLLGAIVAGVVVMNLLFIPATDDNTPAPVPRERLKTSAIDYLELWIEERQNAYQQPLRIPAGIFSDNTVQ